MRKRSTIFPLFFVEALSVLTFTFTCFVAQALPKVVAGGPSRPLDTGLLPVVAAVVFFILQRQYCNVHHPEAWESPSAAASRFARYLAARAFIPVAVLVATWYGIYLHGVTANGAGLLAFGASAVIAWFIQRPSPSNSGRDIIRGTDLCTYATAQSRAARLVEPTEETIVWGALALPERVSEGHFCVVGATGSGKTLSMQQLMKSVLPHVATRPDTRALIFDAKGDTLSTLSALQLQCPVITLNPFDARSFAWDMAEDITDPAATREIAAILIPEKKGEQNPFYTLAAQSVIAGVLKSFILTNPKLWTLRDVLNVASSPKALRKVLAATPETEGLIERIFEPQSTLQNTMQTVSAATDMLGPVAALWHRSPRKYSLSKWLEGNAILVLGKDWTYDRTMRAINRVLFHRLTQMVLNASDSRTRRTWFFIDELKEAGTLDTLPSLLSFGRSRGVRVAVGFQDIEGLRDQEVYGEKRANEMLGLFANKSVLRLDSEATALWASKIVGEELGREHTANRSIGPDGTTSGTTEHVYKREAVMPSEFMRLPPASNFVFSGYHVVPTVGVYVATWDCRETRIPQGSEPNFESRSPTEQLLVPWSEADERRLCDAKPEARASSSVPEVESSLSSITRMSLRPSGTIGPNTREAKS